MAVRKKASKTSRKATIDVDWNDNQPRKKEKNKAKKQIKKLGSTAIILAVVFLVVGAVGGFFGVKFISRNDCFAIIGNDEITLQLGESYKDEGVEVVAFGKDVSNKVNIETDLTENSDGTFSADAVGTYYMVYTVKNIKYGSIIKVQKIRLITYVEASEGEETYE